MSKAHGFPRAVEFCGAVEFSLFALEMQDLAVYKCL